MNGDLTPLDQVCIRVLNTYKGKPSSFGIIIPANIRRSLHIKEGDEIQILLDAEGKNLVLHRIEKHVTEKE